MQAIQRTKKVVRTPEQMAKIAMRDLAKADLAANGLGTEVKVTVEYMGIRHQMIATPTVKLETGEIGFYCGARGRNQLPFEPEGKDALYFGVGFNVSTGQKIDNHAALLAKYGLELSKSTTEESDLDAGETTV